MTLSSFLKQGKPLQRKTPIPCDALSAFGGDIPLAKSPISRKSLRTYNETQIFSLKVCNQPLEIWAWIFSPFAHCEEPFVVLIGYLLPLSVSKSKPVEIRCRHLNRIRHDVVLSVRHSRSESVSAHESLSASRCSFASGESNVSLTTATVLQNSGTESSNDAFNSISQPKSLQLNTKIRNSLSRDLQGCLCIMVGDRVARNRRLNKCVNGRNFVFNRNSNLIKDRLCVIAVHNNARLY